MTNKNLKLRKKVLFKNLVHAIRHPWWFYNILKLLANLYRLIQKEFLLQNLEVSHWL